MTARAYNPSVRIGNWQEDIALQEEKAKEFERKRANGTLVLDHAQTIIVSASAEHRISKTEDGYVHFGDTLVLRNPASNRAVSYVAHSYSQPSDTLVVSAALTQSVPLKRSVFTVAPRGASMQPGAALCFGDHFSLVVTDPFGHERHLRSERVSLHGGVSLLSGKQAVSAVDIGDKVSHNDAWTALCIDPQLRIETEGQPVPANTPILIVHVASNVQLSVLSTHLVRSELGAEPEVVCNTALNSHKVAQPSNHWVFEMEDDGAPAAEQQGQEQQQ